MKIVHLSVRPKFKPGDLPPPNAGYLDWHEWAEVQRKAGIKQQECGKCGRWNTPQELSAETITVTGTDRRGAERSITKPICTECATTKEQGRHG